MLEDSGLDRRWMFLMPAGMRIGIFRLKKAGFSQVLGEPIVNEAGEGGLGEFRGD